MADQICSYCAFINPAGFNFCGQCGSPFASTASHPVSDDGELSNAAISSTPIASPAAGDSATSRVERRQLTVLFCDLVGSTALSQQFDPEDFRKIIRSYQNACQPAIESHGGYISRFLGDGILAYFGYPRASEHDAEQAVNAGLGIVHSVKAINWSPLHSNSHPLSVRVGIATGVVVAGEWIGEGASEQATVVGETPNLAARLQSLASPNTVLIASLTRRLIGERFNLFSLGEHELKGFAKPVPVWRVESPISKSTRFEAKRSANIGQLVNRTDVMSLMKERWSECKNGTTRVLLVSGEPGIGKSRVIQALRDHVAVASHFYLRFQCSRYHMNTAFYPIASQIERAARFVTSDSAVEKREKLKQVMRLSRVNEDNQLSAIGSILSLSNAPDDPFEQLSARAKKVATINAIFEMIIGLSYSRPVLAVVEDVHWIDPTSLELIERFNREIKHSRILTVLSQRTDESSPSQEFLNAEHVKITRLQQEYSNELVTNVAGLSELSPQLIRRIVAKADGVPLFVEELTKSLLIRGASRSSAGGAFEIDSDTEIPETLHDLLMARLDQLGTGKRVAQVAAVIGRQFDFELLDLVFDMTQSCLFDGLKQLARSGLVFADGVSPDASYSFMHALVRDAAYGSLLHEERRDFHHRIAAAMEAWQIPAAPELIARHYTEAGLNRQAIDYWLIAGQQSSQRSALVEAVDHFKNGLALLRTQTRSQLQQCKMLEYLVNLGPAMIATRGSGEAETEEVYREAVALTESLPESEDHFTAHWGWWRISRNFQTKAERALRLQQLAERLDDDGLKMQAHHCQWPTRFHLGDHVGCQQHIDAGIKLYSDRDYRAHAARYGGHDARVCALGGEAQLLWLTGFPQKAIESMRRARLWAEELKQTGSMVHVMDTSLLTHYYRRDATSVAEQADELSSYAIEHQFPEYTAKALVFKGWALTKNGDLAAGLDMMQTGIASHVPIGTNEDPPVWLEMLADGYLNSGEYTAGLDTLQEALKHTQRSGLKFWLAELHRRRGELLQCLGEPYLVKARESMELAIDISSEQGALSLQLRATTSLLRNAIIQGRETAVRKQLARILDRFSEGFDTPDFLAAKALLDAVPEAPV